MKLLKDPFNRGWDPGETLIQSRAKGFSINAFITGKGLTVKDNREIYAEGIRMPVNVLMMFHN